jgi:hypothetical protein
MLLLIRPCIHWAGAWIIDNPLDDAALGVGRVGRLFFAIAIWIVHGSSKAKEKRGETLSL